MKKIYMAIQKITEYRYLGYILIFILTCIIMAPIFTMDLTQINDAKIHLARILAVDSVIKDGIFPPIIDIDFMNGFGYALNLFYGPITTFIPIILFNIFGTTGFALKIFTVFAVLFSGINMYNFTFNITKRRNISTITALIYMALPYKLSNIYARSAVGEYTAYVFIPLVFEGIYNIIHEKKKNYLLCIGIVGLVLSHTITTIYTAIFAILFLLLNINKLKDLRIFRKITVNIFIAFLICLFYATPLIEHITLGNYVIYDKNLMHTSSNTVYDKALEINDLFSNEFGEQDVRYSIGIIVLFLILIGLFTFKKRNKEYKEIYWRFGLLAFISIWMTTKYFPWFLLPDFFGVIQFPWRCLGFFSFFVSLICGINAVTMAEKVLKSETLKDTFIFAIILSTCIFSSIGVLRNWNRGNEKNEKIFDEVMSSDDRIYVYGINREYLPQKAYKNLNYIDERENKTYILKGEVESIEEEKNKLKDVIYVKNAKQNTILELPYLYYLGYDIEISYNGNEAEKVKCFESDSGFLAIEIDECDNAIINVEYKGTMLEKLSYIISLIGIGIFISYVYCERRKVKNNDNKGKNISKSNMEK